MAKKYELPAELPKIQFGVLPDLHKYPVIKNIMPIVHWMHKHWGEGGGGQAASVTFTLSDYVQSTEPGTSVTLAGGCEETTNLELWNKVVEAVKAGKKVYLKDQYLSTNNGDKSKHWVDFTYEVDVVHAEKADEDDLLQFTAHGQTILAGEGGAASPKLFAMVSEDKFSISVNLY